MIGQVQNSIDDLKVTLNLDSTDKHSSTLAKHSSLKAKVKESEVTLNRTNIVSLSRCVTCFLTTIELFYFKFSEFENS